MVYDRLNLGSLLCFAVVLMLFSCQREPEWKLSEPLIEVADLREFLDEDRSVKVIDMRPEEKYLEGHLPGALNVWRTDITDTVNYLYPGMMVGKRSFEKLLSKLGIQNGDAIVVYDAKGQVDAARLWWMLEYYGYSNCALLNGGIQAWKRSGGEIETKAFVPSVTEFTFKSLSMPEIRSEKEEVLRWIEDSSASAIIVDCRSRKEYTGEEMKNGASRAGRIPGSLHVDYLECINIGGKKDCTFKTAAELKTIFEEKGINKEDTVVVYCHSGVRSAHSTFVLSQLLGYKQVKNYDGSWVEWSFFEDLPMETGEYN